MSPDVGSAGEELVRKLSTILWYLDCHYQDLCSVILVPASQGFVINFDHFHKLKLHLSVYFCDTLYSDCFALCSIILEVNCGQRNVSFSVSSLPTFRLGNYPATRLQFGVFVLYDVTGNFLQLISFFFLTDPISGP